MNHENPTGRTIKVLFSPDEIARIKQVGLKGLPSGRFVQLDFSPQGYLLSTDPPGIQAGARRHLEAKARRYLKKHRVLT